MNIAVLIGVAKYDNAAHLPACTADVAQMRKLLEATRKYDEVCCLTTQTASAPLKDALRGFFSKYKDGSGIEEAFFYFSGHGTYTKDALLCCSDFDSNRPATTSISNEELDDLLRSISPAIAVKVIDACQSGSQYIKDASDGFVKALQTKRLNSVICMFSCRSDQSSYASAQASDFTDKLINAALYKKTGAILYRDIQAALADAFVSNPEQTPFFVNQGNGLELFAEFTDDMHSFAVERNKPVREETPEGTTIDLIEAELVRLEESYVSQQKVIPALNGSLNNLASEELSDPLVARFYKKTIREGGKIINLPRCEEIAGFAQEQGWANKYFVEVMMKPKIAKDNRRGIFNPAIPTLLPSNLRSTQSLPFEEIEVAFDSEKNRALRPFVLYIGIVHSLTEVMVLSIIVRFAQKGWSDRSPELSGINWRYQSYLWKDVINRPNLIWEDALKEAEKTIKQYLEGFIPKPEQSHTEEPKADAPDQSGKSETKS